MLKNHAAHCRMAREIIIIFGPICYGPPSWSISWSRCKPLLRTYGGSISRETQAAVVNLFQVTVALREARTSRSSERCVLRRAIFFICSDKTSRFLESPETPGTGRGSGASVASTHACRVRYLSAEEPVTFYFPTLIAHGILGKERCLKYQYVRTGLFAYHSNNKQKR